MPQSPELDAIPAPAVESWLYAMETGSADGSATLYRLGVTASQGVVDIRLVGETGVRDVFDIAFMGNRMFAVSLGTSFGSSDGVILEIDPRNARVTPVGLLDVSGEMNSLVGESNTTLIAATTTGEVWRIAPDALTASRIGSFGAGLGASGDLAFGPGRQLYATLAGGSSDVLATVNLATGRATPFGSIGFPDVFGLALNPMNNTLLGVVEGTRNPRLVTINRNTGAATIIGRIPVGNGIGGMAAGPAPNTGCPSGYFTDPGYPGFCFRVSIGPSGDARAGAREPSCLPETICVSGAIPGRAELFLRILGPRPNGFLWPTIIRFTPSRVVVDILQLGRNRSKRYVLPAVPPGVDDLSGLQDRVGFMP